MVRPFRSGEEEEGQDEVHRDEADADTARNWRWLRRLSTTRAGRSDGPDAPDEQDREHDADQDGRHRGRRDAAVGLKCRDLRRSWFALRSRRRQRLGRPARCGSRRPVRRVARLGARRCG